MLPRPLQFLFLLLGRRSAFIRPRFHVLLRGGLFRRPVNRQAGFIFRLRNGRCTRQVALLRFVSLPSMDFRSGTQRKDCGCLAPCNVYSTANVVCLLRFSFRLSLVGFPLVRGNVEKVKDQECLCSIQVVVSSGKVSEIAPCIMIRVVRFPIGDRFLRQPIFRGLRFVLTIKRVLCFNVVDYWCYYRGRSRFGDC